MQPIGVTEAAEILHLTEQQVYNLIKEDRLPARKIAGVWVLDVDVVLSAAQKRIIKAQKELEQRRSVFERAKKKFLEENDNIIRPPTPTSAAAVA